MLLWHPIIFQIRVALLDVMINCATRNKANSTDQFKMQNLKKNFIIVCIFKEKKPQKILTQ